MYLIETFENMVEMYTNPIKIDESHLTPGLKYSNVTLFLRKQAKKLLPLINKLKLTQTKLVTISLLFNAFALYNLIINEYEIFIVLLLTSYFIDILYEINLNNNTNTRFSQKYYNITGWFKLCFISLFIYIIYFKKITLGILILVFILTLINNLHYSIESTNKTIWSSLIKNKEKLLKFTKNFDETMTIFYFILIIIYIHYS